MHNRRSTNGPTLFSVASHLAILGFLILAGHHSLKARIAQSRGSAQTILYWQGVAASRPESARKLEIPRKVNAPHPRPSRQTPLSPSESQSAPTNGQNELGGAHSGSADVTPAYPVFFPSPHIVDRSLLPLVTRNVVVDVDVSAQGDVLNERLVMGLGNSLDQIVLDTVRTWKFHPANDNGAAVASMAELIFPLSTKWTG
jgi:TonB family protein